LACYIFGAGSYFGLIRCPAPEDTVIAADGGWRICREEGIVPDLLLGDFDSLHTVPDFGHIRRVPVEKDDTDMMLAIKEGLARGETDFRLYGGVGGRTDHTIANLQGLLYLAERGAKGGLYVSVLTHPTTGGVTASFASLGDIMLAEPGALIGFAGPRVIEQTIGEKLPAGFQRSEFQMEHGFVDQVVPRSQLRDTLIQVLQLHAGGKHE